MPEFNFDAVIFDLDGVITQTASVHSSAWKQMFDEFLKAYSKQKGLPFRKFSHNSDYLPYVDGKPRYEGVASFLESRKINLPYGDPSDDPKKQTICGLGNRKNALFNELIDKGNFGVFTSTVSFIKDLLKRNIKVAVASSSKNCKKILDAAGLTDLFETRVDGLVSAQLGLKGKPEPDIFTTACKNLGVTVDRAVVVEDAVSGVQAGRNGQFGLVLGIARENNRQELLANGADIVVTDLAEISLNDLENWFIRGLKEEQWTLSYPDYSQEKEAVRESLCTVGNGYFGTRGALEESQANGINYPGTYLAGLYNRLESEVAGRKIVNEDLVNCPNWLPLNFKTEGIDWLDLNEIEIIDFYRRLDFRNGTLYRKVVVKDRSGNRTLIQSTRIVSMANPHLAGMQYTIKPLNYSKKITIKSGLNGNIVNSGVARYRQLNSKHWQTIDEGGNGNISFVVLKTNQSGVTLAEAAKLIFRLNDSQIKPEINIERKPGVVYSTIEIDIEQNQSIIVEKIVSIFTSKEAGNPRQAASNALKDKNGFAELLEKSSSAWMDIWKKIDIKIEGQRLTQKLIRLNLYHTMITASPHNATIDAGIPARGLHGEAYRGHVFWDEMFILPIYYMHFPETAKSVLLYRYRRLEKARANAAMHGYRGAMFPWQSGSDGREETQVLHLNPLSGKWGDDYSSLQRHVSLAIAYNIWQYYRFTADLRFLEEFGAEMFLEICRFWASKAEYDPQKDRFDIAKVMGPDEYHEAYPGSTEGGMKNNTYTNIMTIWAFNRAFDMLDLLSDRAKQNLFEKINLNKEELNEWRKISSKLQICISEDNILEQFEGYFKLAELDWDAYKAKYGNISRLDRILKAEGKSPDEYKTAKQADTLMVFYCLPVDEVLAILQQTGHLPGNNLLTDNFKYYLERTSHGSTLSKLVHSYIANLAGDGGLSYRLYSEALQSDYQDVQGGTTGEGIHTGVMAGSAFLALKSYAGLNDKGEYLSINPRLPDGWRKISFNLKFRGRQYYFEITPGVVKIKTGGSDSKSSVVFVQGRKRRVNNRNWEVIELTGENS